MLLVISLCLLAILAWLWSEALRAREMALARCRRACRDANVQLLDQTVMLTSWRLARDVRGNITSRRRYRFEFSALGNDRYRGEIVMVGPKVEFVRLEHPGGPFILADSRIELVH